MGWRLFYSLLFGAAVFLVAHYYMNRFLDWVRFQSLGTRDFIVEKLSLMFIDIPPNRVVLGLILAAVLPFFFVFLLFLPNVWPGLFFGLVAGFAGWLAPKYIVAYLFQERILKFNLQMVDGLALMSNGLKSGLSVVQALDVVAEQMPNPMSQEFNLVLSENKVGVSIEEAFNNLAKRVKCEDVDMFVTSINILKETGGNLSETLDTIVYVIRERVKLEGKVRAMTRQGFYQGMVLLGVPPFIGIYFSSTDPELMNVLVQHPIGWAILAAVIVLELAAYFTIKKVVKVDV